MLLAKTDPQVSAALVNGLFVVLGAVIGGVIGLFGSWLAVRWQSQEADRQARLNDQLARKREGDREEREFHWRRQHEAAMAKRNPALQIGFDVNSGRCVYPHKYQSEEQASGRSVRGVTGARKRMVTDWYISVLVTNVGGGDATNYHGYLDRLERHEDGDWKELPIHGPLELVWAYNADVPKLGVGVSRPLNVIVMRTSKGSVTGLKVQVEGGMPTPVAKIREPCGLYRFLIQVAADQAEPSKAYVYFRRECSWAGKWTGDKLWFEEIQA